MSHDAVKSFPAEEIKWKTESLPFSKIPHQSKLFLDYQQNPNDLLRYYPNAVGSHVEISAQIGNVLSSYQTDRNALCDVLEEANRGNGSTLETLANIKLLRESDCVAVVSGQQAGLFTGPLYTIYKALSAVKLSECLRSRGFKAVPVFWIATEDHDFLEVSNAFFINKEGDLTELRNEPKRCYDNLPVGYVKNDASIRKTIAELFDNLTHTEFTDELREMFDNTWADGVDYGDAFARMLTRILGRFGLIVLCPLDPRLKRLATPIYVNAITHSGEMVTALRARSEKLVEEGYHAQVLINEDYFPLFYQAKDKTRHALKKTPEGTFKTKDIDREFTLQELAALAEVSPEKFSPSVVLRSVVQDYLLPTICYFGGAAEIAYFAQSAEVYRILGRPVTPIFHRQSFTLIEPKHAKTLRRFELKLEDLFAGEEHLKPGIVEKFLNGDTTHLFDEVESTIETGLKRLESSLRDVDPTLADNSVRRSRKILHHIATMRNKFYAAEVRKDEAVSRQIETMFASLLPNKHLQERTLNISAVMNKHGEYVIDWIYEAIDFDDKGHRILFL